jgi:anti-sigma B factor antagonist
VPLSFHSRLVGDVTVLECSGRIVEGAESAGLLQYLDNLLAMNSHVLLHLGGIDFIDSSGIGLLVRVLTRAENASGKLTLCALSPKIRDVLRVTRLHTIFDTYEAEAEAIAGFYRRPAREDRPFRAPDILCVEKSADVLAYVRELLRQAGHAVVSSGNLPDALTLLTATRPKLVVIGAELRAMRDTRAASTFNRLADALSVIELPANFSTDDAGEAGRQLLGQVNAIIGPAVPGPLN